MMASRKILVTMALLALAMTGAAEAEVSKVRVSRQFGLPYLPMIIIEDQHRRLWAAFRQLSPRCQELLRIVAFVPRPDYATVAAELGMQIGSIGPTRGRCLAKLRAVLDGGLEENVR